MTGGNYIVYGPNDTLLETNNHLAVAHRDDHSTDRVLLRADDEALVEDGAAGRNPLLRCGRAWQLFAGGRACTRSDGIAALAAELAKIAVLVLAAATAIVLIPLMPDRWDSRMRTLETYEAEGSAMSRIYAWRAAWNIATDRFLGGGFEYASPEVSAKYSPAPDQVVVAHSIYFQMLGEHGFVGLALFLIFWALVWRQSSALRRHAQGVPELRWAYSLMSMVQASLVGYAVGGAFINISVLGHAILLVRLDHDHRIRNQAR